MLVLLLLWAMGLGGPSYSTLAYCLSNIWYFIFNSSTATQYMLPLSRVLTLDILNRQLTVQGPPSGKSQEDGTSGCPNNRDPCLYGIGCTTMSRTLIPNLGYEAVLIGLQLWDPGPQSKSCRKSCRKRPRLLDLITTRLLEAVGSFLEQGG